jgi:hypothetical protein
MEGEIVINDEKKINCTALADAVYTQADYVNGFSRVDNFNSYTNNPITSFEAAVYVREINGATEVVIAYKGSKELKDFYNSDRQLATGKMPEQVSDAMSLYDAVNAYYQNANISLTGHSLGGTLAQIVAFDVYKETGNAIETVAIGAPNVRDLLYTYQDTVLPDGTISSEITFDPSNTINLLAATGSMLHIYRPSDLVAISRGLNFIGDSEVLDYKGNWIDFLSASTNIYSAFMQFSAQHSASGYAQDYNPDYTSPTPATLDRQHFVGQFL